MLASSRKPCGGGNVRGRIWDPPLRTGAVLRATGTAAANRTTVGRGALTPPDPAAAQTPAGGMNPAPTNKFYVLGDRDGCGRALEQTSVGDDAISARFAAVRAVLASLVKGRWPSEARTEGLFRREMPLTEGGAFWRGPRGRHFAGRQSPSLRAPGGGILPRGNPPVCGLCPQPAPFDKGACSVRILGAAQKFWRAPAGGL